MEDVERELLNEYHKVLLIMCYNYTFDELLADYIILPLVAIAATVIVKQTEREMLIS